NGRSGACRGTVAGNPDGASQLRSGPAGPTGTFWTGGPIRRAAGIRSPTLRVGSSLGSRLPVARLSESGLRSAPDSESRATGVGASLGSRLGESGYGSRVFARPPTRRVGLRE